MWRRQWLANGDANDDLLGRTRDKRREHGFPIPAKLQNPWLVHSQLLLQAQYYVHEALNIRTCLHHHYGSYDDNRPIDTPGRAVEIRKSVIMAALARVSTARFLLPEYGFIRHQYLSTNFERRGLSGYRYASTKTKGKQIVLEKPAKFNPPSHGARLPRKNAAPRHYGGDLGAAEAAAQKVRDYPGMMAPDGSWGHWFWNSRRFHLFITLVGQKGSCAPQQMRLTSCRER